MTVDLAKSKLSERAKIAYDFISEFTHCDFLNIILVTQFSPVQCGRELHKGVSECHEARITVGHLVGSLPQPEILKKKKKK